MRNLTFESRETDIQYITNMVINRWSARIYHYYINRSYEFQSIDNFAAYLLRDLTERKLSVSKTALKFIKEHGNLRFYLNEHNGTTNAEYASNGQQPEICVNVSSATNQKLFSTEITHRSITELLRSKASSITHELTHAYDDWISKNKALSHPKAIAGIMDTNHGERYWNSPPEINARYYQAIHELDDAKFINWKSYAQEFLYKFKKWNLLSSEDQRNLTRRLARHWLDVHEKSPKKIDTTPLLQKLSASNKQMTGLAIYAHDKGASINVSITNHNKWKQQQIIDVFEKLVKIADIYRKTLTTSDLTPSQAKSLGFKLNSGRHKDYAISEKYIRPSIRT